MARGEIDFDSKLKAAATFIDFLPGSDLFY